MKITELNSEQVMQALGTAGIGLFRDNLETIKEIMNHHDALIVKALYVFTYGVMIRKNQERNRRA